MAKFKIIKALTDDYEPIYRIYEDERYIKGCMGTEEEALKALDKIIELHKAAKHPEVIKEIEI